MSLFGELEVSLDGHFVTSSVSEHQSVSSVIKLPGVLSSQEGSCRFGESLFGVGHPLGFVLFAGFYACTSTIEVDLGNCLDVRVFDVRKTELTFESRNSSSAELAGVDLEARFLAFFEALNSVQEVLFQEHLNPIIFAFDPFAVLLI